LVSRRAEGLSCLLFPLQDHGDGQLKASGRCAEQEASPGRQRARRSLRADSRNFIVRIKTPSSRVIKAVGQFPQCPDPRLLVAGGNSKWPPSPRSTKDPRIAKASESYLGKAALPRPATRNWLIIQAPVTRNTGSRPTSRAKGMPAPQMPGAVEVVDEADDPSHQKRRSATTAREPRRRPPPEKIRARLAGTIITIPSAMVKVRKGGDRCGAPPSCSSIRNNPRLQTLGPAVFAP